MFKGGGGMSEATKCAAAGLSPGLERRARPLITSCQRHAKKNNAQLNAQLYFFWKKRSAKRSAFFFLLLSVGLRGEVDPRESLPLKSPFLTAPVFRYIVRLAFASVKHNVLVRVHLVKRGFTLPPEYSFHAADPYLEMYGKIRQIWIFQKFDIFGRG